MGTRRNAYTLVTFIFIMAQVFLLISHFIYMLAAAHLRVAPSHCVRGGGAPPCPFRPGDQGAAGARGQRQVTQRPVVSGQIAAWLLHDAF